MIPRIVIQPYVTWQINRFDHLKAITGFLRARGLKPAAPKPAERTFADNWVEEGEWIVWRSSKPIPPELIEEHFEFPQDVERGKDSQTGSAIISCEKSKTAIGHLAADGVSTTAAQGHSDKPNTSPKRGASGKIIIPQPYETKFSCADFFPLTDYLKANGCTPVFKSGNEALAKEAIDRLWLSGSHVDFLPQTPLADILAKNERGWLPFIQGHRFPEWYWFSVQPIPSGLFEPFEFSTEARIGENRVNDWQLSAYHCYCVMSMNQLRSFKSGIAYKP
jgi:hypothetical protein